MKRQIVGLKSVRRLSGKPSCIPIGRPRGAKAAGLRYERELARMLPDVPHGPWLEFEDANGKGYCQADFVLKLAGAVVVLECKYTWTATGHVEMDTLYKPLLGRLEGLPVLGVQVCKKLTPETPSRAAVRSTLAAAISAAWNGPAVWHWLGVGGIGNLAEVC